MKLGKILTDFKGNIGALWIWIGIVLLLLNVFVVGIGRWEFWYGLTYSLGWLALGIVLSIAKPSIIGALFAALSGVFAVVLNLQALTFLTSTMTSALSIVLFIGVLAVESKVLNIGKRGTDAKYVTLLAFGASALFGILYFYNRITLAQPLNFQTIMYHGGISVLAGFDFITVLGKYGSGKMSMRIRLSLAAIAIIGALLLTTMLGWGLTLIQ